MDYELDHGLMLYLPLHRLDGSSLKSADAYGHLCSVTGALWTLQGRSFDGIDDFINIDAAVPALKTAAGTLEMWVKVPDATPVGNRWLAGFGDTDDITLPSFRLNTDGTILFDFRVSSVVKWILQTDAQVLTDDTFAHVLLVHNGVAPILVVNGAIPAQTFIADADKTVWLSGAPGIDNGRIGCVNYGNNGNFGFANEVVGEFRGYTRALSQAEYTRNYQLTKWRYQ